MSLGPVQPTSAGGGAQPVAPTGTNPAAPVPSAAGQPAIAGQTTAPAASAGGAAVASVMASLLAEALPTQDGIAPLLADLATALATPASAAGETLPAAARLAAQRILAGQAPLGQNVGAGDVRTALQASGILLEATLAASGRPGAPPPDLTRDLKAQLLQLSAALDPTVEAEAASLAAPRPLPRRDPAHRPPPPARGAPTAGQAAAHPSAEVEHGGAEARARLRQEADAALARLQLSQLASAGAGAPSEEAEETVWRFDAPLETPSGTALAQIEIRREGHRAGGGGEAAPVVWRTRLSADLEPSGPVHAEISLSAGRTRVTLWAERDGAFGDLSAAQAELVQALAGPDHADAAVRVLFGAPPPPAPAVRGGPVGHYLDRRS
ncbi:flagellar hook-length control protein FliK [Caulobacter sp. KR2-114]|uniref:flagellar hook-length control protein FliK n=1 Tax=Caulobacter sp. KR2-114 TaxID=3400912 RepID=UPI003C044F4B